MKRLLSVILLATLATGIFAAGEEVEKINRACVLERNNPVVKNADPLNSLSVGNGHFATTVDVTGMQSYPQNYELGVPLCSMSDWGWHSFPNKENLRREETEREMDLGHGRKEVYAVENKVEGRGKKATEYFRVNPHRLNLGNVALVIKQGDRQVKESEIEDIDQRLSLYNGVITSRFSALGYPFTVNTACMPCQDAVIYSLESKLLGKGNVSLALSLPYPSGKHADAASDWNSADKHSSRIVQRKGNCILVEHCIDDTKYYILMQWEGKAVVREEGNHTYSLFPKSSRFNLRVEYSQQQPDKTSFSFAKSIDEVRKYWNQWWETGAFVDFGECKDIRAKELERRTVLSQYLTFINCANETPAQETGLTYNSWYGRPHLEMTWWHTVDFALWNRPEVLERMLEWYNAKAYPEARRIAQRQNFKGIRWMKMTDPWVGESPSNVGSFLTWQQPHYIYMAEEMWRIVSEQPNVTDAERKAVLDRYGRNVEETAEFLCDFALSCAHDDAPIQLYGQTAMQESMSKDFSYCHPFEQVYFTYGLATAQKWRERMGKERRHDWDEVIRRLASLPQHEGIYTAGMPSQPFLVSNPSDTISANMAFDPFNYGGESGKKQLTKEEFYLKCRSDHPAVLGACGLLPYYGHYDRAMMQRTLDWVMENWNWETTWGWDYGMTAMCAARLGDGENAVKALLIDKGKNTYLVSGHNYQEPKRLRLYLPGNGAFLDAIAMMCAGWDGCPDIPNPGFPQNGKWNVKWEGLRKMQ